MYFGGDGADGGATGGNEPSDAAPPPKPAGAPDGADTDNARVAVRFLLSGASAGSIIGKGGATITEFETQSGARIQLSKPKETFPGTGDRILLVSGTINAILTALHLLLSKLLAEESAGGGAGGGNAAGGTTVKVVVPNAACGAVLGKEGATIRSYTEDSGAVIKVSPKDAQPPGVSDRVVTISGSLEQALRATALVVTRVTEEPSYPASIPRPYSYAPAGAPMGGMAGGASPYVAAAAAMGLFAPRGAGTLGLLGGVAAPASMGGASTTLTVAVPDEHVGAIIGRNGQTISEMQLVSGVSIKVSSRDDMVAHTNHRKVTLTGAPDAVQIAQFLISQKVSQSVLEMEARRGHA
jgi:RNA-binding protein Nova